MATLDKPVAFADAFSAEGRGEKPARRPLCVDLDGSLCKSDTLADSVMVLLRRQPLALFQLPGWLAQGKAAFKREVETRANLDVEHLPYNRALLAHLHACSAAGQPIFLTTGADESLAQRLAKHLGFFSGVLASDGHTNLTGHRKLQAMQQKFGAAGFDYIGNSHTDLPLLQACSQAGLANCSATVGRKLGVNAARFEDRAPRIKTVRRAVRVQQWAKNILLFVPLLLAHASANRDSLRRTVVGFVAFCLAASATYIVNDLLDIEADRRHPNKRTRPFAAGDLQATTGVGIAAAFVLLAAVLAIFEPNAFRFWLAAYFVTTLAYSFYLKRVPLVDVLVLAGLYTVRIVAGGAAAQVPISPWLGAFSLFFFLSLAIVKRYSELHNLQARGHIPANGRGYLLSDLEQLRTFGTASGYASVVVFTLYINSDAVAPLYHHSARLWLLAPILIYWVSRVWLLAARGHMNEDPLIYALTDRVSLLLGMLTMVVLLGAAL